MNTTKELMITLLLVFILPVAAIALPQDYDNYEFTVDGIYYKIINNKAVVTMRWIP